MTGRQLDRSKGRIRRLGTMHLFFMVGFLAVSFMLVLWSVVLAPVLNQRDDNPRVVAGELNLLRGSIWARENVEVARTTGTEGDLQREYPFPYIGPAVGYYSFVHGTAGVENGYDNILRGETDDAWAVFWQDLLNLPQTGRDVRVTLETDWQRLADALMGDQKGAITLMTTSDSAIRVMVSKPAYDPNRLEADFEELAAADDGPLLNRAAQSPYQPGMALQPFLLAAGMANGDLALNAVLEEPLSEFVAGVTDPVQVNGGEITCRPLPDSLVTWGDVLKHACPAPMVVLGDSWGEAKLDAIFNAFGFTTNPQLPINTETLASLPVVDAGLAAIGQENLVVTPLQMNLALATLAADGAYQQPLLVPAVQNEDGEWLTIPRVGEAVEVVPAGVAADIVEGLPRPGNIVAEHVVVALSGPEGGQLVWYLGLAPAVDPRYAVVIVLEESDDIAKASQIGRTLLESVLAPDET